MKAKVYCEVTCCHCGGLAINRYYKNPKTITAIKRYVADWIWDEKLCGNLCPDCQQVLKQEGKE